MSSLWVLPALVLVPFMLFDEFVFHRRRGLPRWERIGHPLDTLTVAVCYSWALWSLPTEANQWVFLGLSVFSCVFVTKDELIHSRECQPAENYLHAFLFLLHPLTLIGVFHFWTSEAGFPGQLFFYQFIGILLFGSYQLIYWNLIRADEPEEINNDFYDGLKERWYEAEDDPIALLRQESQTKSAWVADQIRGHQGDSSLKILDIGCGAGFLSNSLASAGHDVIGVDLSEASLEVAKEYDKTKSVQYKTADAYELPFEEARFDVVCAMDFLEHVEDPARVVKEARRVLKPGGLFFFHTFNRNPLAYLVIIKLVEWLVPNTPENMHILRLFIKPNELQKMCESQGIQVQSMVGLQPHFLKADFWKSVWKRRVLPGFQFRLTSSLLLSYMGYGKPPEEAVLPRS